MTETEIGAAGPILAVLAGSFTLDDRGVLLPSPTAVVAGRVEESEHAPVEQTPVEKATLLGDGIEVTYRVTTRPGSVEWRTTLANRSRSASGILADLRPLDIEIGLGTGPGAPTLHRANGSRCRIDDFAPVVDALDVGTSVHLEPVGGRSSDGAFPFLAVDLGSPGAGAVAIAIGWSGQWCADVECGPDTVRIRAGLAVARLRLEPGESITLPSILAVTGADGAAAMAALRSTLLRHYLPAEGVDPPLPIAHMTMASFHRTGEATEAGELAAVDAAADLGVEAFWIDASWYGDDGDWSANVGNWYLRTASFPRGLRPISDAAHERGMRFVWWIEPERARPGTRLAREHPEYFLGFPDDAGTLLLDLGNAAAREHVLELVSGYIDEFGVDVYRQDFNVGPLPAWRAADRPDRVGIHEIRHVEGLYWLWDRLRERHPGLLIDNCASGGRRIDIETVRRSVTLWRSDAADVGGGAVGSDVSLANQVQCAGLSSWLGVHTGPVWGFSPYEIRSALAPGFVIYCALPEDTGSKADLRAAVAELARLRPSMSADVHRTGSADADPAGWSAIQYHRPDTGVGFAAVYRRPSCPQDGVTLELRDLDPAGVYDVQIRPTYAATDVVRMTGDELAGLRIDLPPSPAAVLVEYSHVHPRPR